MWRTERYDGNNTASSLLSPDVPCTFFTNFLSIFYDLVGAKSALTCYKVQIVRLIKEMLHKRIPYSSFTSLLIGSILTSVKRTSATLFQISVALLLLDSKEHVMTLYDFA